MNNFSIYFLGSVFGSLANVLLWYILPRIYTSTEISEFFLFFSTAEFIGGLLTFGGDAVLIRYFRSDLNKTGLLNLVIFTSVLTFLFFCFVYILLISFDIEFLKIHILITGLLFSFFNIHLSVYQAELKAKKFVYLSNMRILLLCFIPFIDFVFVGPHISLCLIYPGSLLITVIMAFFISEEKFRLGYNYSTYYYSYAFWSLAIFVLSYISSRIMAYLMASGGQNNEELVVYLSFLTIITLFNGLASMLNRYFQVIKFKFLESKESERYDLQLNFITAFSFLCLFGVYFVSKVFLFPYYFAKNFQDYYYEFIFLIMSLPFLIYYTFMYPYVYFKDKLWLPFLVNVCKICLQIVAFLMFDLTIYFLTVLYLITTILEVFLLLILYKREYHFFSDLGKHMLLSSLLLLMATFIRTDEIDFFGFLCFSSFIGFFILAMRRLNWKFPWF